MHWLVYRSRIAIFAMLISLAAAVSPCFSDEIIIEEGSSLHSVSVGDFSCSPCFAKLAAASFEMDSAGERGTIELTAGELWQFFAQQGYQSVNTMTLVVDIDELPSNDSLSVSKLNFQIQSPHNGNLVTDANLGTNRLVVPGIETSSSRPEAELRFDLGYDFMKLFTPESTEIVRVSIDSPLHSEILAPKLHLVANDAMFGHTNLGQMFLFILFWGAVFLVLLRWMKPVRETSISIRSRSPVSSAAPSPAGPIRQRTA